MIKKLFVCRSYYHIYCAIKSSDQTSKTTILCIDYQLDRNKLLILKERIESIFPYINVIVSSTRYKDIKSIVNDDFNEIYFFHWVVYKMPEMYIYYSKSKKCNFFMIEDGVNHYGGIQKSIINKKIYLKYLINYLLIRRKDLVLRKNVKRVYVTYLDKYPNYMKEKLSPLKMILRKDLDSELLNVFDVNLSNISNLKSAIVLTQPLSEDGFITESYKIKIYEDTVHELVKSGYHVFFKSHPREKTKYKFSNEVTILDRDFPAEILNFTDLNIRLAVAVSSGSLDTINADYKVRLAPDFFKIVDYKKMDVNVKERLSDFL